MANYKTVREVIKRIIRENDNEEITGNLMQSVLLDMVESVDAGMIFKGLANPATVPDEDDANVFYVANEKGTYNNFGQNIILDGGSIAFIYNNGDEWIYEEIRIKGLPNGGNENDILVKLSENDQDAGWITNEIPFIKNEISDLENNTVRKSGDTMTGPLTLNGEPTTEEMASTKKYVDDKVSALENNALTFKGFVSVNEPVSDVRDGNSWYQPSEAVGVPDTGFPWAVKTYTGGAWSSDTQEYTPVALDLWNNMDDGHGYYYLGDRWEVLDFSGSVFNDLQFVVVDGKVSLKPLSITNAEIATNAAIEMTKIDGLESAFVPKIIRLTNHNATVNFEIIPYVDYVIIDDTNIQPSSIISITDTVNVKSNTIQHKINNGVSNIELQINANLPVKIYWDGNRWFASEELSLQSVNTISNTTLSLPNSKVVYDLQQTINQWSRTNTLTFQTANANTLVNNGIYALSNNSNNIPSNNSYYIVVYSLLNNIRQIAYIINSNNLYIYTRIQSNSSTWTNWTRQLNESDLAAITQAITNLTNSKLNINQGTANAGMILGVGNDGIVAPIEGRFAAASYPSEIIQSLPHTCSDDGYLTVRVSIQKNVAENVAIRIYVNNSVNYEAKGFNYPGNSIATSYDTVLFCKKGDTVNAIMSSQTGFISGLFNKARY